MPKRCVFGVFGQSARRRCHCTAPLSVFRIYFEKRLAISEKMWYTPSLPERRAKKSKRSTEEVLTGKGKR